MSSVKYPFSSLLLGTNCSGYLVRTKVFILSVCVTGLTFSVPPLFVPTPLSPVLEVVSVPVPVSVPPPFACPQKVVVPGLLWTFHTHSRSVSVPARAHLQSHRAQTLQARPVVLRPGQGVQGPVGEQPGSSFGAAGTLTSALPAVAVALEALQRVLQGVAATC